MGDLRDTQTQSSNEIKSKGSLLRLHVVVDSYY